MLQEMAVLSLVKYGAAKNICLGLILKALYSALPPWSHRIFCCGGWQDPENFGMEVQSQKRIGAPWPNLEAKPHSPQCHSATVIRVSKPHLPHQPPATGRHSGKVEPATLSSHQFGLKILIWMLDRWNCFSLEMLIWSGLESCDRTGSSYWQWTSSLHLLTTVNWQLSGIETSTCQ